MGNIVSWCEQLNGVAELQEELNTLTQRGKTDRQALHQTIAAMRRDNEECTSVRLVQTSTLSTLRNRLEQDHECVTAVLQDPDCNLDFLDDLVEKAYLYKVFYIWRKHVLGDDCVLDIIEEL